MSCEKPNFNMILYHGNCADGFTAAWAFWLKYPNSIFLPQRYGSHPPNVTGKTVAIVDFSFSKLILTKMIAQAEYLIVLDHHKSAQRDLVDFNPDPKKGAIVFDMNKSGAQIAWDYLNPNTERPWFIEYVADRDLWKHALPHTKQISQALFFEDYFKDFNKLNTLYMSNNVQKDIEAFILKGTIMMEFKDKDVNTCSLRSTPAIMYYKDVTFLVRLICCPRQYRSDVGNKICELYNCDIAVVYYFDFASNQWWISMRTNSPNIDLSIMTASLPNGGGHPKAAGFVIEGNKGDSLYTYFKPINF